jgi:hypothetical protein
MKVIHIVPEAKTTVAYKHLIDYMLAKGFTISVFDGEEWQVKRSTDATAIDEAIRSVEEAELSIRDKDGNKIGWAKISAFGLEPDETVMDNTMTDAMNEWDKAYEAMP